MVREPTTANRMAVEYVTVLLNAKASKASIVEVPDSARVQEMINEAVQRGEMSEADVLGALGLLATRAVEDLARSTGEASAFWLQRWLAEPFG
jgi:hypothetical protein